MADDADMRNELSDMQQRADQLADEVSFTRNPGSESSRGRVHTIDTNPWTKHWEKFKQSEMNCLVSKFK